MIKRTPLPVQSAPASYEVHPRATSGWEIRGDGGRALSSHGRLVDALTLAVSLARRSGASVVLHEPGKLRTVLPQR